MGKKQSMTKTYVALTRITHDGDVYQRGDQVDLTDEQAAQLLEGGIVKPFLGPAPPAQVAQKAETPTVLETSTDGDAP